MSSDQKKTYKLIIVVIASPGQRYDEFLKIWKQYDKKHDDIKVFYVFGKDHIKADDSEIVADSVENLIPGILLKTVYAMDKIHKEYNYDFLLRTNLSSFFVLPKLYQFLDTLPKTGCYTGMNLNGRRYVRFVSGSGIIMSRDVIYLLLSNKRDIDCGYIDDYTIGKFMRDHRVIMRPIAVNRVDDLSIKNDFNELVSLVDQLKQGPHFHFRLKAIEKRYRKDDSRKMALLYDKYYRL